MRNFNIESTPDQIATYLKEQGWLAKEEIIQTVELAGEGNMNVVLRIVTEQRSLILKQSRPFVRKYPQVQAPVGRIAVEKYFYETVGQGKLKTHLPNIVGYDARNHVLVLEDLGNCKDMTYLYAEQAIDEGHIKKLVGILRSIHAHDVPKEFPKNMGMRRLNHQHIFELPFRADNGFDLDTVQPGLQSLARSFTGDTALKKVVEGVGKRYLSPGNTLLHGDYYPGSWMQTPESIFVIDPEFGFAGFPEFDLGVLGAHVVFVTGQEHRLDVLRRMYETQIDGQLLAQVAGIEIIRRLIGLAQLPMDRTLEEKRNLLEQARRMVFGSK